MRTIPAGGFPVGEPPRKQELIPLTAGQELTRSSTRQDSDEAGRRTGESKIWQTKDAPARSPCKETDARRARSPGRRRRASPRKHHSLRRDVISLQAKSYTSSTTTSSNLHNQQSHPIEAWAEKSTPCHRPMPPPITKHCPTTKLGKDWHRTWEGNDPTQVHL